MTSDYVKNWLVEQLTSPGERNNLDNIKIDVLLVGDENGKDDEITGRIDLKIRNRVRKLTVYDVSSLGGTDIQSPEACEANADLPKELQADINQEALKCSKIWKANGVFNSATRFRDFREAIQVSMDELMKS